MNISFVDHYNSLDAVEKKKVDDYTNELLDTWLKVTDADYEKTVKVIAVHFSTLVLRIEKLESQSDKGFFGVHFHKGAE